LEEGLPHREEAVSLLRNNVDPRHPSIPPFLSELAHAYCDLGRIDDCRRTYGEALAAAGASPRVSAVQTAIIRISAARAASMAASFEEAREAAEGSVADIERALGPDSFWIGLAHYQRARALNGLGRFEEGLGAIAEARRRLAVAFGETSLDVLLCEVVRGALLGGLARHQEAAEVLRRLVAFPPEVLAADSAIRQEAWSELAKVELAAGNLGPAQEAARQALALAERIWPEGTRETADAEILLGTILLGRGDRAAARAAHQRASALAGRVQGFTPPLAASLRSLGAELGD
jgi:tetratricopeptide (TPR) repeat protein